MKYEAPMVPCEESEKRAHSASPPIQIINEKRMRIMVRFKAITKCSAFENRACYSETCTPKYTQMDFGTGAFPLPYVEGCT